MDRVLLSLPFALRYRLAYDAQRTSGVLSLFVRTIFASLRRRAGQPWGIDRGQCGAVSGKAGTAEFGADDPRHTHAWFTGFQGDIAFAVLVEDSGFGGEVAAPIARDFLTLLAG